MRPSGPRADRTRHREKVRRCLDAFARMLRESHFDFERPHTGLEIELNLVDDNADPLMRNAEVLAAIADPDFQTELGQFNIEINLPPRPLSREGLSAFEENVRSSLNEAQEKADAAGSHIVMIGILPTLLRKHMTGDVLSANPRYALLNEQIFAARGEDLEISIAGEERLYTHADTVAPESACTSVQFHLQVAPESFGRYWNASQAIAAVQLAVGANSPYLFGGQLWRETRIALFEQATDTRPDELKAQGVRPRVWFGERWITSIFDLFEENVRYFPALLPLCESEDPLEMLDRGDLPHLGELTLHHGPIYRWNRPVCAVDARLLSLRDWWRNVLSGSDLMIEGGIGAFVARRLGAGLDIRCHTPATRIEWDGRGGGASPRPHARSSPARETRLRADDTTAAGWRSRTPAAPTRARAGRSRTTCPTGW